jgi:hypothetical protein
MFPPGAGGGFPPLGPSAGSSALDGPPPSPTPMGEAAPGATGPFSMSGVAGPVPSTGMPPEVLTGVTQSAQQVNSIIDSWAQIAPDKAAQLGLIKDLLQQFLADLMAAGAGPVSPTASGPAFPGGGIDRGIAGAGAV